MKLKSMTRALLLSALLSLTGPALAEVPQQQINDAIQTYRDTYDASREAGERPGRVEIGKFIDQAFKDVPVQEMSLDQIDAMLYQIPVYLGKDTAGRIDRLLIEAAEQPTADGAHAASIRIMLLDLDTPAEVRARLIAEAFKHPSIAQAMADGHIGAAMSAAGSLPLESLLSLEETLIGLAPSVTSQPPTQFFEQASQFFMNAARSFNSEHLQALSPLREKLAAAIETKLQGNIDEQERPRLERAHARLTGAYASGKLLGQPAPALDFTWYRDKEGSMVEGLDLDQFKGKVVVLDFFATWCGPCIASFPNVAGLTKYYEGYDVVVIGVTSLQGFHSSKTRGRVDTTDKPDLEHELMLDFINEHEVTWAVGFTEQPVFNYDYGVTGIPHMTIIDATGVVRYNGMHPASKLDEKVDRIDPLLVEGGASSVPARDMTPRQPAAAPAEPAQPGFTDAVPLILPRDNNVDKNAGKDE